MRLGDMGIATPSEFLALNDLVPTLNSLIEMFVLQNASGALPYCGPTISCGPERFFIIYISSTSRKLIHQTRPALRITNGRWSACTITGCSRAMWNGSGAFGQTI